MAKFISKDNLTAFAQTFWAKVKALTGQSGRFLCKYPALASFDTRAELLYGPWYYGTSTTTLQEGDYAFVTADETHGGKSARYMVLRWPAGSGTGTTLQWAFVNTFDGQFSTTQIEALNSGITLNKRMGYDATVSQVQAIAPALTKLSDLPQKNVTYAELVTLRDAGNLIAGMNYRITDYVTTVGEGEPEARSAGHPFDLIVTASSPNSLSELARATLHEGDTYFSPYTDCEGWQIWYSLDNDTTRFSWADEINGKGVIYRMIDEWMNDCPYDFKNVQFVRTKFWLYDNEPWYIGVFDPEGSPEEDIWFYTFSWVNEDRLIDDVSLMFTDLRSDTKDVFGVRNNKIESCIIENYTSKFLYLNNNIIANSYFYDGGFFYGCDSNTFGNSCYSNTFGNSCSYNTFGNFCYSNTFGNDCRSNTFGYYCYSNTFGYSCSYNTFGNDCSSNTFGDGCRSNTFGYYCYSNTFGNSCYSNTFGNFCSYNTFGNDCRSNTFGNSCSYNTFGNFCYSNTFGNFCSYNATPKFGSYYRYITLENGVQYTLIQTQLTTSYNSQYQNVHIHEGVKGTYNNKKVINPNIVGQGYSIDVYAANSITIEV